MATALPLLSDSIQADVFSSVLPVPRPLETQSRQVGFFLEIVRATRHVKPPIKKKLSFSPGTDHVPMEKFYSLLWTPPSTCLGRPTH